MVTARFGDKKFKVTGKMIYTPNETSISESIDIEETERKGKKPSTKIKGVKLQTLSFTVILDARFVTISTELRWWKSALLSKKSKDFYLGSYKIGRFYLNQYDISEININKNGVFTKCKLSLSFTEDGNYAGNHTTNFNKIAMSNSKASSVKSSASSSSSKKIRIGSVVKPKSNTRWYYTAEGALNKKGKSGKATVKSHTINYIYNSNKNAIHLKDCGWMRKEDVTIIKY